MQPGVAAYRSPVNPRTNLVLLPGLDGSGILFQPLLRHLHDQICPLVIDYPPDRPLGYEQLLPLVSAKLPSDERVVLLGESFSGPLAMMIAAKRPSNLAGLILCASFLRNPIWFRPRWLGYLARPTAFRFFPAFRRIRAMLAHRRNSELPTLFAQSLSQVRPDVLSCRVRAVLTVDVRDDLRACTVPLLYLRGGRDLLVPPQNAKEIVSICPSARVVRIPSSHWVLQTQPEAAARAISSFVLERLCFECSFLTDVSRSQSGEDVANV